MPAPLPSYYNDGSGRDTFINHAGAYWTNPLPGGTHYRSMQVTNKAEPKWDGEPLDGSNTNDENLSLLHSKHPGQQLYGKSRYGTTVLRAEKIEGDSANSASAQDNGTATRDIALPAEGHRKVHAVDLLNAAEFDGESTAMEHVPSDVANPERRLNHPGHAREGTEGTGGGSTFSGVKEPWTEPNAVDNTYLRLAPTYESTMHHSLRTGLHYTEDEAPPHENTLPEKGTNWGKSRYYP